MKEVTVKLTLDDKGAVVAAKNIQDSIKDIGDEAEKTGGKVGEVGKSASKSKKGFATMAKGLKAVGVALKAAGIGLIVALVAGLTEAFSRNKRIMDGVSIVLGTIQEVFTQVADALIATYDAVAQSSDNFDALGKVMGGILTLFINPFKISFFAIQLALQAAQLAWEDSFFGGGDEEKMAQLRLDIEDTKTSISEVADEMVEAGSTIVDNFAEAVTEVGKITDIASENLSKVSIKAANETAKAHKAATDAAIIAQAMAAKNIALFDRQAEQQRQIRDDANKSIKERQEANIKLGEILEKQEEALLKQAAAVEAGARAEFAKNNSIDNRAALIAAEAATAQVLADIEGKRSEQKSNTNTLLLEEKGLITSVTNAEKERNKIKRDFDAEQELDPLAKLQKQKSALELENTAILEDLEAKRLLFAEGTQQRVDAEQDYLNQKQGIDNQLVAVTTATNKQIIENDKAAAAAKVAIQEQGLEVAAQAFSLLGQLGEDNKALQATALIGESGIGIAKMIIANNTANIAALATPQAVASSGAAAAPVIAFNNISTALGVAATVAATAKGLAALGEGGAPTGGDAGAGGATAPAFNLVEGTESNAIQDSITNQDTAIKAIVVSGDVTTAQSADRNAIDSSGF